MHLTPFSMQFLYFAVLKKTKQISFDSARSQFSISQLFLWCKTESRILLQDKWGWLLLLQAITQYQKRKARHGKREVETAISMFDQNMFTWLGEMAFSKPRLRPNTTISEQKRRIRNHSFCVYAEDRDVCQPQLCLFFQTSYCKVRTIAEREREKAFNVATLPTYSPWKRRWK